MVEKLVREASGLGFVAICVTADHPTDFIVDSFLPHFIAHSDLPVCDSRLVALWCHVRPVLWFFAARNSRFQTWIRSGVLDSRWQVPCSQHSLISHGHLSCCLSGRNDGHLTWKDISWLKTLTDLPIVVSIYLRCVRLWSGNSAPFVDFLAGERRAGASGCGTSSCGT